MKDKQTLSVAVLGASDRSDRYSFKAIEMLREHGHIVHPISHRDISLPGLTVHASIADIGEPVHTVTLYVNPHVLETVAEEVMEARPKRVIFNPGTEHPGIEERFQEAGIEVIEACTLVMLGTGQFVEA